MFAHGSPRDPVREYMLPRDITDDAKMRANWQCMERTVCFVGHSHIPLTVMRFSDEPSRTAYTLDSDIDLTETVKALINVGSVGQPRDEIPDTAYALFDAELRRASILRIPYDIEAEIARINRAGLPQVLGERLRLGV